MKIVAINGSHRGEKGFTQFLINKLFEGAKAAGAECETIVLAKHKINHCIGCNACHSEKSYLKCIYDDKDDVKMLFAKMREADMLVYATPVYVFNMSGILKTFIDRINSTADSNQYAMSDAGLFFHHVDASLCSKPFALLITQDNLEVETAKNIVSYFKTYVKFVNSSLVGILIRKSGKAVGHGKMPEREKLFPKIYDVYEAYKEAGKELATSGRITARTQKKANQNVLHMPKIVELLVGIKPLVRIKKISNMFLEKAKEAMN